MISIALIIAMLAASAAGQDTFKCGCAGAVCSSSQSCSTSNTCIDLPTQNWLADGAPFCVRGGGGRCCGDNFAASCTAGQACVDGKCVTDAPDAPACGSANGACYTCKTPNVKSFFDGCNQCSCGANGAAACTERACIAVVPDSKQCGMQCDGFVTDDDGVCGKCLCIGGQKTNCSKSCQPSDPCAVQAEGKCPADTKCVVEFKQCITTPCPQYRCDKTEPTPVDPCAVQAEGKCPADTKCVPEPKQCFAPPCPQYRCDKIDSAPLPGPGQCLTCATLPPGKTSFFDGCNHCSCGAGGVAGCTKKACIALLPNPKQCTAQCDGFKTLATEQCGVCTCDGEQMTNCSKCGGGPCGVDDEGKFLCLAKPPITAPCDGNDCKPGQVCVPEPKQCVTTPCPQFRCEEQSTAVSRPPRDGKCYTCATPGVKSFFDGCNGCGCDESGNAACTLRACIALAPADGSCELRCDGALVTSQCQECLCINGAKTECRPIAGCTDDTATTVDRDDDSDAASAIALASAAAIVSIVANL